MSYPESKIFSVGLKDRNFAYAVNISGLKLIPERYSWHAIGGPLAAEISVESLGRDSRAIWETLELLRCPVEIYDHHQKCVWWGYVSEVEITVGSFTVGVSLDSMSNKVGVTYEDTNGLTYTTWRSDDDSVNTYGTKEVTLSSNTPGPLVATYVRDQYLNNYKKPIPQVSIDSNNENPSAKLICSGWWQTLSWRYYLSLSGLIGALPSSVSSVDTQINFGQSMSLNQHVMFRDGSKVEYIKINSLVSGTTYAVTRGLDSTPQSWSAGTLFYKDSETTAQIKTIVAVCGQFLTGTEIKNSSGYSSDPYRSGENSGLFEIQGLLESGTSTGLRLLCGVSQQRELIVWVEPDLNMNAIELFIRPDGKAVNAFNIEVNSQCPVGVWARLKDVVPGSLDIGILADPSVFFVEEASYSISENRYIPVPRGQGTPYGIGTRISEG